MTNRFKISGERHITQEMNELLTSVFLLNPTLGEGVFGSDRRKLSALMRLMLLYYSRLGVIYTLRGSNNKLVSLSVWGTPTTPPLGLVSLLTRGFFFETFKCAFTLGLQTLKRLLYFSDINEKHHLKEPHYYLFMVGSTEKGGGRILLNHCIDLFAGNTIFWESSVAKDNHAYYKSFGAEMVAEEVIFGQSNGYFVLRTQGAAQPLDPTQRSCH